MWTVTPDACIVILETPFLECSAHAAVFRGHFRDIPSITEGKALHVILCGIPISSVVSLSSTVSMADPPHLGYWFLYDGVQVFGRGLNDFTVAVPYLPSLIVNASAGWFREDVVIWVRGM